MCVTFARESRRTHLVRVYSQHNIRSPHSKVQRYHAKIKVKVLAVLASIAFFSMIEPLVFLYTLISVAASHMISEMIFLLCLKLC